MDVFDLDFNFEVNLALKYFLALTLIFLNLTFKIFLSCIRIKYTTFIICLWVNQSSYYV